MNMPIRPYRDDDVNTALQQFIICKTVPSTSRPGKTEKMPCDLNGKVVSLHVAERMSHANAVARAALLGAEYRPAVILTGDGRFCIDLDDCLQADNTWSQLAIELCTRFSGCMTETSTSGKGLHIFGCVTGDMPDHGCKNIPLNIECYTDDRFICLGTGATGDMMYPSDAAFNQTVAQYFPAPVVTAATEWTTTHQPGSTGYTLGDDELIAKACDAETVAAAFGHGVNFRDLWTCNVEALADKWPRDDESYDASQADGSLAQRLAWWTGNNAERIKTLMLKSAMVRPKWSRHKSYLQRTILGAMARQTSFYNVPKVDAEAVAKALCAPTLPTTPTAQIEPLAALVVQPLPTIGDHVVDAINTMREGAFKGRLGSFEGAAHWWNGQCWEFAPDADLRRVIGLTMIGSTPAPTNSRINGIYAVMRDHLTPMGQIDPPSRVVFFNNGALDVRTGAVTAHNAANRNSRVIPVDYDPSATCPEWQAWLGDIFRNEPERATLLQEMIGWTLCRDHLGIEKALMLIGPGRSGKGTIIRVLRALLGNGAGAFTLPTLDDNKALAGMRGQNVTIDSDAASPARNNARQIVGLFKAISSNEPVPVKLLYTQMPWQGALNCKLMLAANSIPTMWDDSAASANRWIPLVFDRSFLGNEDVTLADRLTNELQGIAAWAVIGLQRLAKTGRFTMPQSTRDELANMVISGSPVEQFITDRLTVDRGNRVTEAALWTDYSVWCTGQGHESMKRRDFMRALEDALRSRGVKRKASIRFPDKIAPGFEGVDCNLTAANVYTGAQVVPIR